MKRQTRSEQIQNAIDTTLSGLKDDPRLAQQVIRAARQMETPKRKRFYGMVLAALLLLLAATAVAAAYLSAQQFVQQEVLPLAQENDADGYEEKFSNQELAEIVRLARENGIALSDEMMAAFENGYGYYEQSAIMEIVSTALGKKYYSWSIEEKYWFGEVMVLLGFRTDNPCRLPSGDDASQQDCLSVIQRDILETYGDDITDSSIWEQSVSFETLSEDNATQSQPHWYFQFDSLDLRHNSYSVELTAQGQIVAVEPLLAPSDDSTGNEIVDQFQQVYGFYGDWTVETWATLGQMLKGREPGGMRAWFFACAEYILPPENSITQAEAERLAFEAVGDAYTKIDGMVCCMDRGTPIWKMEFKTLYPQDIGSGEYSHIWLVEMDCASGKINDIQEYSVGGEISPFIQWVPRSVIENPPPMPENG